MCQFITVKESPALGYLYNNVCNDVTCAGMPVHLHKKINCTILAEQVLAHMNELATVQNSVLDIATS